MRDDALGIGAHAHDERRRAHGQPRQAHDNTGKLEHDVTIPALGVALKAGAGKSATQTVTPTKEGTFDFLCSIAGHKKAGMQGSLTVGNGLSASTTSAPALNVEHASRAALATTETRGNQPLAYTMDGNVKVFEVTAQHVNSEVLPGEFVDAYAYNGQVPGSLIRATEGDAVRINFTNELPEPTVIHFHGPRLPNSMDGVVDVTQKVVQPTKDVVNIGPGERYDLLMTADNPGTWLFHCHILTHVQNTGVEPGGMITVFKVTE